MVILFFKFYIYTGVFFPFLHTHKINSVSSSKNSGTSALELLTDTAIVPWEFLGLSIVSAPRPNLYRLLTPRVTQYSPVPKQRMLLPRSLAGLTPTVKFWGTHFIWPSVFLLSLTGAPSCTI